MRRKYFAYCLTALACGLAIWLAQRLHGEKPTAAWQEVAPGVWRSTDLPHGYALVNDGHAILIDAPHSADGLLQAAKVSQIDRVLLTHHHLDTCAKADAFLAEKVLVQAPRLSAPWLTSAGVQQFWKESIPLRNSRTAYFVVPVGFEKIDCSLDDGQVIDWRGWKILAIATPGHSRDHMAYYISGRLEDSPAGLDLLFCGDALAKPGRLWTPFTTDWDHWTDAGLTPTAQSLRKLAALKPKLILPAHGEPIRDDAVAALEKTAANVEEVAFLKSFSRYSKQRLGNAPSYPFLVPREQIASAGEKPWAKISEHLYITGNTYVLLSKDDRAFAVVDPWGQRSADQVEKLKKDLNLGKLELVLFSHAHFDHYDGVYELPGYNRKDFAIWSLDLVSEPLGDPFHLRAPFLDARPVRFDRRLHDGETASWREYSFRFHHLPGQSYFTMGLEATIDGKRCYFTADNFFHQDQFSGSGGWMGLNRSWPLLYAASAKKVLDANPEWVLAEHGGPYEFNAEDFRRRVQWGEACAKAADAICVSGNHRRDWDPYRVQIAPILHKIKPGSTTKVTLMVAGTGEKPEKIVVSFAGRGLTTDQSFTIDTVPGKAKPQEITLKWAESIPQGRHVFPLRIVETDALDAADAFFAVDVE